MDVLGDGSDAAATAALCLAAALTAWAGTRWVGRHAMRLGLLHEPNRRSSHVRPTPHGGGLAIVLGGSAAGLWLAAGQDAGASLRAVAALAFLVAALGLRDDIRHVPQALRLGGQALACVLLLAILGDMPAIDVAGAALLAGFGLSCLLLLAGLWWINLFNFMDGIDGMAGTQAVFMLVAGATAGAWLHPGLMVSAPWIWMVTLAAATLGFLAHNWPPARIFMGDVGSTYLAFMVFALALASIREGWLSYPFWAVLAALFVADATVTLLVRMAAGERWFEAHRSHAYQRLARRWNSHARVTRLANGINLAWVLPLALATLAWPQWAWGWVALAYAPVVAGVAALGAGRGDDV